MAGRSAVQLRDQLRDYGGQDDGWRLRAGCRGADTEEFYASGATALVMRVCRRCEVRTPCLESALVEEARDGLSHGYRGGLTAGERRRMLAEQAVPGAA